MRSNGVGLLVALLTLVPVPGYAGWFGGGTTDDVEDIRATQKKILERLDAQEKILKDIQGRMQARPQVGAQPDPNQVYEIPIAHSPIKGAKSAPVTLVEFSDFQCPFCAQASSLPDQLLKDYPKELRFVYKQMPLVQIHPNAMRAAKASVAAGKQGKFWEMHDELFKNNRQLTDENIKKIAKRLNLDMKKFDKDMTSPETEKLVQSDVELAGKVGVRGTPTFFLNGKRVMNRSPEALKTMIDAELKKKGG